MSVEGGGWGGEVNWAVGGGKGNRGGERGGVIKK